MSPNNNASSTLDEGTANQLVAMWAWKGQIQTGLCALLRVELVTKEYKPDKIKKWLRELNEWQKQ